jgi:hypothetical protein
MREGETYVVALLQPGGPDVVHFRTTESKRVFDRLPYRPYTVAVSAGRRGGKAVNQRAIPSAEQPEIVVELDVSALEPKK